MSNKTRETEKRRMLREYERLMSLYRGTKGDAADKAELLRFLRDVKDKLKFRFSIIKHDEIEGLT